jgi:predicted transposase YdaD
MTKSKPTTSTRGTDETFLKLMTMSGSSLLKLLGIPSAQANKYRFRSITLKEKTLKPDVEAIPMLKSQQGPVFIEFQGYSDPFIRYRLMASIYQSCAQQEHEGGVIAGIIYTDPEYQKAALSLNTALMARGCKMDRCLKEIVLTQYTERRLSNLDPKLMLLAPFTLPKQTEKVTLLKKSQKWRDTVMQTFPTSKQREALDILGLFILNRFRQITYEEVVAMLHFDLMDSVAGRQVYDMGYQKGEEKGEQKGHQAGMLEDAREMLIEALEVRFARVPKTVTQKIKAISQRERLKALHRQAMLCETLKHFKESLAENTPKSTQRRR